MGEPGLGDPPCGVEDRGGQCGAGLPACWVRNLSSSEAAPHEVSLLSLNVFSYFLCRNKPDVGDIEMLETGKMISTDEKK